jgi:hypothetical protein
MTEKNLTHWKMKKHVFWRCFQVFCQSDGKLMSATYRFQGNGWAWRRMVLYQVKPNEG